MNPVQQDRRSGDSARGGASQVPELWAYVQERRGDELRALLRRQGGPGGDEDTGKATGAVKSATRDRGEATHYRGAAWTPPGLDMGPFRPG